MRKFLTVICLIAAMAFANTAMATIWTAHGDGTPFNFGVNGDTYKTELSLFSDGFTIGDSIFLAALVLDFDNAGAIQSIKLDNVTRIQNSFTFGLLDFPLVVPNEMLSDGVLTVEIAARDALRMIWGYDIFPGNLTLDSISLIASGTDNTPVPEPGSVILIGAGLFGLAIYGKRRQNA